MEGGWRGGKAFIATGLVISSWNMITRYYYGDVRTSSRKASIKTCDLLVAHESFDCIMLLSDVADLRIAARDGLD